MSDARWNDPREYDARDAVDQRPRVYDPRDPDEFGVGLRCGQRELPLGHPVPLRQGLGHDQRVLGGEEELVPCGHPLGDGSDDRRGGVPAECAHVRDVHVHVLVAVKVPEPGSCPVRFLRCLDHRRIMNPPGGSGLRRRALIDTLCSISHLSALGT